MRHETEPELELIAPCRVESCPIEEEHPAHEGQSAANMPEGANPVAWAVSDAEAPLCPDCLGWKVQAGGRKTCPTCKGRGRVSASAIDPEESLA